MSARFSLLALFAGAALAGCNAADPQKPAVNNVAREPSPAPPAAPVGNNIMTPARAPLEEIENEAEAPAERQDPARVTRAWFAGRWSDTGDCAQAGHFAPNGTYLLVDGTRGMWTVQDGKLFVQHAGGRATVRVRKVDERTVEIVNEDGSVGRSIRC